MAVRVACAGRRAPQRPMPCPRSPFPRGGPFRLFPRGILRHVLTPSHAQSPNGATSGAKRWELPPVAFR